MRRMRWGGGDPLGLRCGRTNTWIDFQRQHKGHFKSSTEAASAYKKLVNEQETITS